jgi:hypothetical protein
MSAERQNCEASRGPLLGNGFVYTPVAKQWLNSRLEKAATDTNAIEELLEAVFSVRSVPRLYNEDQLPLSVRPILSSERMLHKDYDRKGSISKKISGHEPQEA